MTLLRETRSSTSTPQASGSASTPMATAPSTWRSSSSKSEVSPATPSVHLGTLPPLRLAAQPVPPRCPTCPPAPPCPASPSCPACPRESQPGNSTLLRNATDLRKLTSFFDGRLFYLSTIYSSNGSYCDNYLDAIHNSGNVLAVAQSRGLLFGSFYTIKCTDHSNSGYSIDS